jgi:hypothetical protein
MIPKYFNVAGPCVPEEHYMIPAIERLPEVRRLTAEKHYFVIHSARQSGKTTLLRALTREINAKGLFYALYCSLEALQGITKLEDGMSAIVDAIQQSLGWSALAPLRTGLSGFVLPGATIAVSQALSKLSAALDKPLVIFFDEADCLGGQVMITFLRQLRNGYVNRDMASFPWSIALVGMRNIRDFKAQIRPDQETLGSTSPFNIITDALTLVNFTPENIGSLYSQHTIAAGQVFEPEACERAGYWSEGQPWLVNALARQVLEKDLNRDYAQPITAAHIDEAAETLMKRRDTHIDSLLERLKEPIVHRVIEPMLYGGDFAVDPLADDTKFCLDLGLVKAEKTGLHPANPIYRDIMVRALNYGNQAGLPKTLGRKNNLG